MATSPKIMYGGNKMTKILYNGTKEIYNINYVKNGVTTRVYHKHDSTCSIVGGQCGGQDVMWYCAECGYEQGIGNRFGNGHKSTCSGYATSATDMNGCNYHTDPSECEYWEGGSWSCGYDV